jgi:tetratricopeptide (TPR) repeat protein
MANKLKTKKQSGGVNVGGNAKARNIIGRDYKVTVISVGAAFIIVVGITAIVLLSPIINKPPVPPVPTPTPLAFKQAEPGETLLIVADFDDRSAGQYAGIDPAQRIYELITDKLPGSNMKLRVEQYHHPLKDSAEARHVLNAYRATLLIWGWYDKLGAEPHVELDKERIALDNPRLNEVNLATPESFVIVFTKEIPSQSAYVAFFSLGMMQLNLDPPAATAFFTQAIDSASQVGADSVNPWEALMWRGNIYDWSGEYELATADYTQALKLYSHREGFFNRGNAYRAQGKYTEAIADYTQAIAIDPKYKEAYVDRGNVYGAQGKYAEAIADYTQVIAIDPKYKEAYVSRGAAYEAQGKYELAIADFTEAVKISPDFAGYYTGRGNVYADWKKYNEAITDYQKSLDLEPSAYTYCVMGITFTKMGDFHSAITALEQGVKLDVNSDYSWCKTAWDNARLGTPTP